MPETTPPRSRFSDVDGSGAAEDLIGYLDAARRAPSIMRAKKWSLDRLDLHPDDAALDIGCGTGEDVVSILQRLGGDGLSVGVDSSEAMVSEAVRRHGHLPNLFLGVADAHGLPFAGETFDAVRCERTLQHLSNPGIAVGEIARVIRPGGRLTLLEPDWGTLVIEGADPVVTDLVTATHVARHAQPRMGRQLRSLMTAEGFSVQEVGGRAVIYTDLASALRAFGLGRAAPLAIASGAISQGDGDQWATDLERADRDGRFFASVTGFRAFGRKPDNFPRQSDPIP